MTTIASETKPQHHLKYWRTIHHLSIDKLIIRASRYSESVFFTKTTLHRWELGDKPLPDNAVVPLAKALRITVEQLIEGPVSENRNTTSQMGTGIEVLSSLIGRSTNFILKEKQSALDSNMQSFISYQRTMLWDNFHLTEEKSGIATLRVALNHHSNLLDSFTTWPLTENERKWLLQAMSDAAILEGRLARDELNHNKAIEHNEYALKLAIESENNNQIVAAVMRLAETFKEAGLPYEAISYCKAGIEIAHKASARIEGELIGLSAQLYSEVGDHKESVALVERAASLAIGAAKLPTAGGINFSETAAAEYQMCIMLQQGKTKEALAHIIRARKLLKEEFPLGHNARWEAHLWIDEAHAHFAAHDADSASKALRNAARLAQQIKSQITLRKVEESIYSLNKQKPNEPFRMLQEELVQTIGRSRNM